MIDFFDLLVDPRDHGNLEHIDNTLRAKDGKQFSYDKNTVFFLGDEAIKSGEFQHENNRGLKYRIKKIFWFLRPPHMAVYMDNLKSSMGEEPSFFRFLHRIWKHEKKFVVNVWSLSKKLESSHNIRIVNLDISYYDNTDIVANAENLPFKDDSLDGFIIKNVFEHLQKPLVVRDEMLRTLKSWWYAYVKIPFMQPFHAVPDDFQRYTLHGMHELFKDFTIVEEGISVWPASALSWLLIEFFSILFSFNSDKLYQINLRLWRYLLFWFKYFDIFFRGNKLAYKLASAYYMTLQKK